MTLPLRANQPRTRSTVDVDTLAADILGFLAEDGERLSRFFALTGFEPGSLRDAAAQPGFAQSLLDYLASDDRLFLGFAEARGHDPAALEGTRQRLAAPPSADD